jgi:UDP-glucose 4-epimerase
MNMSTLSGSRILVTGGGGFVGSYVVEQLLPLGIDKIIVIDNLIRGSRRNLENVLNSSNVEFIEGDIRDQKLLDQLFHGVDYCFHMAALRITHCADNPREALEVMCDGTFNILDAGVKHKIKRLIFSSTVSVYGQADIFPTSESYHPYNNYTLYGATKMSGELMCRSFQQMYGLNYTILRYCNIYGPRMDAYGKYTEVLIRWYRLIKEGKPPVIFGDGLQSMDFIYVQDIARANITALVSPNAVNDVFNIGEGVETTLKELCFVLLEVMGSPLKPIFAEISKDRQKVEVYRRLIDVSKAKRVLDFEVRVRLKEGLQKLVNWLDTLELNEPK